MSPPNSNAPFFGLTKSIFGTSLGVRKIIICNDCHYKGCRKRAGWPPLKCCRQHCKFYNFNLYWIIQRSYVLLVGILFSLEPPFSGGGVLVDKTAFSVSKIVDTTKFVLTSLHPIANTCSMFSCFDSLGIAYTKWTLSIIMLTLKLHHACYCLKLTSLLHLVITLPVYFGIGVTEVGRWQWLR